MSHLKTQDLFQKVVQVKKIYTKVLCNIAREEATGYFHANQMGQPGIRATETIWSLRMLAEKASVLNKPIAIAKADVQKAFDTIDFDAINKGFIQQ